MNLWKAFDYVPKDAASSGTNGFHCIGNPLENQIFNPIDRLRRKT